MLTLGIDTSAVTASVSIVKDSSVLSEFSLTGGLTHSEHLIPMIENSLKYLALSCDDIDLYAVSNGPGSFTGLRIGIASVKGLAFKNNTPCVGVSTLEALAMRLCGYQGVICPAMDARRNEFYNALFTFEEGELKRICPDRAISSKDLKLELSKYNRVIINGDGALKLHSLIGDNKIICADPQFIRQNAASVALLAEKKYKSGEYVLPESLGAVYLRLPQAERELLEKEKSKENLK